VELKAKRDKKTRADMEWNGSTRRYVPRPESSFSFLYNYNYTPYPGKNIIKTLSTLLLKALTLFLE